jgi:hypothetical protein
MLTYCFLRYIVDFELLSAGNALVFLGCRFAGLRPLDVTARTSSNRAGCSFLAKALREKFGVDRSKMALAVDEVEKQGPRSLGVD